MPKLSTIVNVVGIPATILSVYMFTNVSYGVLRGAQRHRIGYSLLQNPHYAPGVSENNIFNYHLAAWRLKPNHYIELNAREGLVLNDSAEFQGFENNDMGLCVQKGALKRSDVDFHYRRNPDWSIERSAEIPKSLDSIFEPNGLCNYRPAQ